jgi:hypothetical protein
MPWTATVSTHARVASASDRATPPASLDQMRHRSAAVCTGASHNAVSSLFNTATVIEHPAMSSEVT